MQQRKKCDTGFFICYIGVIQHGTERSFVLLAFIGVDRKYFIMGVDLVRITLAPGQLKVRPPRRTLLPFNQTRVHTELSGI